MTSSKLLDMTTSPRLHVDRVEDHEGDGTCGHCGREGLRWIAVLSDGSKVGTTCAKRFLGIPVPSPKSLAWIELFEVIAEVRDRDTTWTLWQRKGGVQTRDTMNGHLMNVGGCREEWTRRGWITP